MTHVDVRNSSKEDMDYTLDIFLFPLLSIIMSATTTSHKTALVNNGALQSDG